MDISRSDLVTEYRRAVYRYSFLASYERKYNLPYMLLFAIGSRETNLTNEVGDYGHGHGMFQLDNRSHTIPEGFDSNVREQADTAARMLHELINTFPRDLKAAISAYNTGTGGAKAGIRDTGDSDAYTANRNYGADVLERMNYLAHVFPRNNPVPPVPVQHRYYTVRSGDSLTSIGSRYRMSWQRIYNANRRTIGNDPNLIFIGERLIIP